MLDGKHWGHTAPAPPSALHRSKVCITCTNPRTRGEAGHASFGLMIAISGPWPRLST